MKLPKTSIIFARNISRRFPSFRIAFAQIFPLLLSEFREKAMANSGKSNEKTRKATAYISGKKYCFCPNFPLLLPDSLIAFSRISHCFCPISHCFCPNFSFSFFLGGGGGGGAQCPPPPPPPPPHSPTPICIYIYVS